MARSCKGGRTTRLNARRAPVSLQPPTCTLILVRHSKPDVAPDVPAAEWRLSAEGRERCGPLAVRLATYAPTAIVSSTEPKAVETAAVLAERLGLTATQRDDLREHDRSGVGYLAPDAFEAAIAAFFRQVNDLVLGKETASRARERFTVAVEDELAAHGTGSLIVVAHGTVITLFAQEYADIEPQSFWRALGMPAYVVFSLPDMVLREIVTDVAA